MEGRLGRWRRRISRWPHSQRFLPRRRVPGGTAFEVRQLILFKRRPHQICCHLRTLINSIIYWSLIDAQIDPPLSSFNPKHLYKRSSPTVSSSKFLFFSLCVSYFVVYILRDKMVFGSCTDEVTFNVSSAKLWKGAVCEPHILYPKLMPNFFSRAERIGEGVGAINVFYFAPGTV